MAEKQVSIQGSFDFGLNAPIEDHNRSCNRAGRLPWIGVSKGSPYFITDDGQSWNPVGHNDAITWPGLAGAFRRRDMAAVESYLGMLSSMGVTCLRLMLEYCQGENRYLEKPAGHFQPNMICLWDDIFSLCEKYSLRILLTPYDTFWMWRRWLHHPYNATNNGVCSKRSQWLLCENMRTAIKRRLYFATERWGSSGALFAWDLWNEIRPSHSGNSSKLLSGFIDDISSFLRTTEIALHGRAHPQTVSVFSPVQQNDLRIAEMVFRHKSLDFATIHLYEKNSIDNPKNTVDAAIATGRLTRGAINELKDKRPFFDSEHGPIKTFNGFGKTLPVDFDEEYFRHMQWAHFASGGAGGGMRWPYRHPHLLTTGMRRVQLSLSIFLSLISWNHFSRVNLNNEIIVTDTGLAVFACGDDQQTVIWLLRRNAIGKNKLLRKEVRAQPFEASIPLLTAGRYRISLWDTVSGTAIKSFEYINERLMKLQLPPVYTDMAVAISGC